MVALVVLGIAGIASWIWLVFVDADWIVILLYPFAMPLALKVVLETLFQSRGESAAKTISGLVVLALAAWFGWALVSAVWMLLTSPLGAVAGVPSRGASKGPVLVGVVVLSLGPLLGSWACAKKLAQVFSSRSRVPSGRPTSGWS
jgi:hypothetical protein